MIKTVIFDWSGTLMDNTKEIYGVISYIFNKLGKEMISFEELRKEFTLPYMGFWNKYFPDLTIEKEQILFEEGNNLRGLTYCFSGVKETLNHLENKGIKLFIVSSDPYSRLISEIKSHGFFNHFSEIITDVHEKDKILNRLIVKYNLNPEETIYIGDCAGDVEAGKINRVKTGAISWGLQSKEILKEAQPDFLIKKIEEIINHL